MNYGTDSIAEQQVGSLHVPLYKRTWDADQYPLDTLDPMQKIELLCDFLSSLLLLLLLFCLILVSPSIVPAGLTLVSLLAHLTKC